jgi:hypothetical protein
VVYQDFPIETEHEIRELVGMCLWDTFSNEHDVVGLDGRLVDIGWWRGAGAFIAEELNRQTGESKYDYMDFYIGTFWVSQRTDLTPVPWDAPVRIRLLFPPRCAPMCDSRQSWSCSSSQSRWGRRRRAET